jgi:hypothetical protein
MRTVGPLRSAGVTPLRRYFGPVRHPLAFGRLPRFARLDGLPSSADFAAGRGGLHQLTPHALDAVLPLLPRRRVSPEPEEDETCCLRPQFTGSASGVELSRGYMCVHFRCGPASRSPPSKWLRRWASAHSVSLLASIQATGVLALTPAGLAPAERASLSWSYKLTSARYPERSQLKLIQCYPDE